MKVICIDDTNKPSKIPNDQWVKKGEVYTVTRIVRLSLQQNILGLILKEIKLDKSCFPYEFYNSNRFIVAEEIMNKSEMMEEETLEADLESVK